MTTSVIGELSLFWLHKFSHSCLSYFLSIPTVRRERVSKLWVLGGWPEPSHTRLAQHPAGSGYQQDKVFTRPLLAAWHASMNLWGLQNPTLSLFLWFLWILGMKDDLTNPPKVIDERVLFRKASGLQEERAARQEPSGHRALAVVLNGTPSLLSEVTPSMGVTNSWKNEQFTCNFKKVPYT